MSGSGAPRSSLDRFISAVMRAGLQHTVRGDHVQVECPSHAENRPSLSADYIAAEGRTLFHCLAMCPAEQVLDDLELTWPMLHDDYLPPEEFKAAKAEERAADRGAGRRAGARPRPSNSGSGEANGTAAAGARRDDADSSAAVGTGQGEGRRVVAGQPMSAAKLGPLPKRLTAPVEKPTSRWETTTAYDYVDAHGLVLQQELRQQRTVEVRDPATGVVTTKTEKKFSQRAPDGKGGWLKDKNGIYKLPEGLQAPLYRLPEVIEAIAAGETVWLHEGAKDSDRHLVEVGGCASTNPSGAGNFKPWQAEQLRDADVVTVVDHDKAGYTRGVKVAEMLTPLVRRHRLALPAVAHHHADTSDHYDAGRGIEDFELCSLERMRQLVHVAAATDAASKCEYAPAEAAAQMKLAHDRQAQHADQAAAESGDEAGSEADGGAVAAPEVAAAARWVAEAVRQLGFAETAQRRAYDLGPLEDRDAEALAAAVTACEDAVLAAHEAAGIEIPEHLMPSQHVPPVTARRGGGAQADGADAGDGAGGGPGLRLVEGDDSEEPPLPRPKYDLAMSRGAWAFEPGGPGRRRRGLWQHVDGFWFFRAPTPYVHARVVSRDGYGRPLGTYYLVSTTPDGPRITIGQEELARHTWPNILSLAVSMDDQIQKAASTAVIFAGDVEAELIEATPRITSEGTVALPMPETLPAGYLATSDTEYGEAIGSWAEIARLAAENPRMALVLGAAAFGPFIAAFDRQPHIVSLYGDIAQGKSVTMRTAAAIWGFPGSKSKFGVCSSWNQSKLAPTAYLGELGVLPAFFDEIGMAGNLNAAEWGKRIFDICEGASRGRPAPNGRPGFVRGRSWYGILLSAGNGRLMEGIGAGDMAGTQRRVVELSTPFTNSRAHADAFEPLLARSYGHLGRAILDTHSADTVRPFLDYAAELLGPVDSDVPVLEQFVKHLHAHIAGAAIVDGLCGTGTVLTDAAVTGAREFLGDWEAPQHDADRILDAIADSLFQEPACWPTQAQFTENLQPANYEPGHGTSIARHGVAPKTMGLADDAHEWIGVIPRVWKELCEDLGVDSYTALRELARRGVLITQNSANKPGNRNHTAIVQLNTPWTRSGRTGQRFYKLAIPQPTEDDLDNGTGDDPLPGDPGRNGHGGSDGGQGGNQDGDGGLDSGDGGLPLGGPNGATAAAAPVTPPVTPSNPPVTAPVTAPTPPLTRPVTAVTAVTAPPSRPGVRESVQASAHAREVPPTAPPATPAGTRPATGPSTGEEPMTTDMATDSTTTANTAWVQLDQAVECQACGQPTNRTLAGVPVHRGECATIVDVPDEQGSPVEPASTSANTPATLQSEPPVRPLPTRPAGGPESWTDLDHRAPCAVCGIPAIRALDGVPLHMGECVEALPAAEPTEAVTEAVSEAVSDVVTASVHAQDVEQSDVKPDEPQDGDQAKAPRWQAPVAVLDEEQVYLPGGQTADWPEYAHLGDLAMLAHRDQLRLGHGGGETLPEPGQIWITSPATLARLGLPEELELPDGIDQMDIRTSREVIKEALSAYADLPPVADAVAAGWEIGDLDGWVYLRHPDELTQGARLVFIPWIHDRLREVALLSQAGSETELADNLAEAAHAMGVQYLIHSGITAHRLINDTRPPRRDADDISGSNAKRIAVVRDTKSELPSFYRRAHDSRFEPDLGDSFKATESDLSWWRPWNLVDEATRARKYVHAYDRKASYLVEWGSCDLGVEDLVHRPEGEATWDGTERAGLWLIDKDWGDWPEPYLPEPYWDSVVAGKDEDSRRVWVTTPTLVLLGKVGITPNVVESYTWGVSTRYLEQAAERLRPMRVHHNPAVAAFAKQVYAVGTGRFGRTDGAYSSDPLWRPDWYDHIRASARLKIMITLLGIKNSTHITPLAAGRDSIVFASDERDPIAAWPGNPKRLGNEPGMWAPEASGLLADWGKEHLPERKRQLPNHGRWNSTKAIDALTSHKRGGTW